MPIFKVNENETTRGYKKKSNKEQEQKQKRSCSRCRGSGSDSVDSANIFNLNQDSISNEMG